MNTHVEEYVLARSALLDALGLLSVHLDSIILVGAQAVYLHAPAGFGAPAYTTDADLALDPDLLATRPDLAALFGSAGYVRTVDPGTWISPRGVHVDLMVPDAFVPGGSRRSAPLEGHDRKSARRTAGLELAITDNEVHTIRALDPADARTCPLKVASPAALVIAKLVKLRERLEAGDSTRILPKDVGDLLRLLRTFGATELGVRLGELKNSSQHGETIKSSLTWAASEVGRRDSQLVILAVSAAQGTEPERQVTSSLRTLTKQVADAATE